jgi:hypothetical protein
LIGIGAVTIQLGAFNFLAPLLVNIAKDWSSSTYGIIAAAAGLGALLSTAGWWTASSRAFTFSTYASMASFPLFDSFFAWSNDVLVVSFSSFMLGWALSLTRLIWRGQIFALAQPAESGEWAARLTFVYQFGRSAFPLLFALIANRVAAVEVGNARWILTGAGISVFCVLVMVRVGHKIGSKIDAGSRRSGRDLLGADASRGAS